MFDASLDRFAATWHRSALLRLRAQIAIVNAFVVCRASRRIRKHLREPLPAGRTLTFPAPHRKAG
jgi:hypothetical protein